MNHNHFSLVLAAVAIALGYFAQQLTGQSLEIVTVKVMNVALFITTSLAFLHFLRGTKYDVFKEIFDQHNVAGAVLIGLFLVACAIVCTVVS